MKYISPAWLLNSSGISILYHFVVHIFRGCFVKQHDVGHLVFSLQWKLATKVSQLATLRHFFLLWKRMQELQTVEQRLTEAKSLTLLSAHFLRWRDTFRFSLMEISASQFWRARIVRECFTEWRIGMAQRRYCAYAEEIVMVTRQSALKKQAFQEWRLVSDAQRQERGVAQMKLLREAFSHWRSLAFDRR